MTNSIFLGDHVEVLQKKLPDNSIDLTVTSPPYDDLRDYDGFSFDFESLAHELYRVTKPGGVVVWVVGDKTIDGSETGTSFRQALYFRDICGFKLHDTMIYEKSAFSNPSNNRYHQIFEFMFVLSKGIPKTFNPLKDRKNKTENTFGKQRRKKDGSMSNMDTKERIKLNPYGMRFNIWRYITSRGVIAEESLAHEHPAIFPEDLAKDHILTWTNPGDIVLDPMCGSGTTLKMAKRLGRKYIGIDCSEKYCKIAIRRVEGGQ